MLEKFDTQNLYRTVVLTILAGIAAVTVALANREVYRKTEVDHMIQGVYQHTRDLQSLEAERHNYTMRYLSNIQEDVRWVIRNMKDCGDDDTESGSDTP